MYFYIMFGIILTCLAACAVVMTVNYMVGTLLGHSLEWLIYEVKQKIKRAGD